ncbi:ribonuclease III [Ascochyta rabiei]|uniref:Ribonuclease III n=1 Tax=Didymella rabiei TaxID=5454 RepID=A0A163EMB8_DIDRA|nr:ribonuclease III [Ascochyta rabiei]
MDVAHKLALLERMINRIFNQNLLRVESINSDGQPVFYSGQWRQIGKNDRLAIVGDRVIDMVLCTSWFDVRNAEGRLLTKGQWSELQGDLVTDDRLARRGFSLGLDDVVIKNPGHHGRISNGMMANAVEAIIGAVYVDSGYSLDATVENAE